MNRQNPGIEWVSTFGTMPGYTANIIKGCKHGCSWLMPDGKRAQCYAKSIAENLAQKSYPHGFAHVFFDDAELARVLNHDTPSGIFMDSMSDLLGIGVPDEWVERIIEVMRQKPQHIFYVLTKNPVRLNSFDWPRNVWLGVSAPATYMHSMAQMGYDLTTSLGRQLWLNDALMELIKTDVAVRWVSLEPLSDDFSQTLWGYLPELEWFVIGAASNGRQYFQPDEVDFRRTLSVLRGDHKPMFFKGNIDHALAERHGGWREEWPDYESEVSHEQ